MIDLYIAELGKPHYPNAEEETAMFTALRNGDTNIKEQIACAYGHLVISIARRYNKETTDLEDLIQEGNIGLLRAAERFDLTREPYIRFTTYAVYWIKQAIARALWDDRIIYLPDNKQGKLWTILKLRDKLLMELEQEPTYADLATISGIPEETIATIIRTNLIPYSLEYPLTEDGDETLSDAIPDPDVPDFSTELDRDLLIKAVEKLNWREQIVIKRHYGLEFNQESFECIGARLNLTKERVRQIEKVALAKLQGILGSSEFAVLV